MAKKDRTGRRKTREQGKQEMGAVYQGRQNKAIRNVPVYNGT